MKWTLLAAALTLASSGVAAQEWDAKETREVQARFGECVVKKHYSTARQFVLEPNLKESTWRRAVASLGDSGCLIGATDTSGGVEMKFPMDTMRYSLADALVRREFLAGPPAAIKDSAPLEQPIFDEAEYQPRPGKKLRQAQLEKLKESRDKRLGLVFLAGFGECVVRENVGNSHGLLMTRPASIEEGAALKALLPQFGACLFAGQELAFSKTALRGTIAMNYYRLAHAPRAVAAPARASK